MNASINIAIDDLSQAGEARRTASRHAQHWGCGEELTGRIALVVTELSRNLALHAGRGRLLLRNVSAGENLGVEILSLDTGPGMANVSECLRDGFSTAGTAGAGLGTVQRASRVFDIHSQTGVGTALLSQIWESGPPAEDSWVTGGVNVAYRQEPVCGDTWAQMEPRAGVVRILVADGLGHGEFAAQASRKAAEVFAKYPHLGLPQVLENIHAALKTTRGAAVSIAELDLNQKTVSYAGVGNVSATIVTYDSSTSLVSMNGTVGAQMRGARLFTYPWPSDGALIIASDGIKTRWQVGQYAGLLGRHPSLISGVLFRDFARDTDDATVVVFRSPA